jgi:hypothetical protein
MLSVELDIYSGRPNPSWILSNKEERELIDRIMADKSLMLPMSADTGGLGYRGYIITALDEPRETTKGKLNLPSRFRLGGTYDKEKVSAMWLLDTSEKPDTEVEDFLRGLVQESIRESEDTPPQVEIPNKQRESEQIEPLGPGMSCYSNWFTSSTDFTFWNGSAYYKYYNNCYNYASNKRTNTFAQPGRYSNHPFSGAPTCSNVANAIVYDGWRNSCQYQYNLSIALAIWPGRDFHFYRKCSGGRWCHKPGRTAARNYDNSGRLIYSPATCNRGYYTQFCGYWYVNNNLIRVR